ncbi:MAG: hypothetical protein LBL79_10890 [Prevotella sp.]|nr:hypothetical protein [Prevotella sp.]
MVHSSQHVAKYLKIYAKKGIDGLYNANYHRKGSRLEEYKESIIEDFGKNPVCSIAEAVSRINFPQNRTAGILIEGNHIYTVTYSGKKELNN